MSRRQFIRSTGAGSAALATLGPAGLAITTVGTVGTAGFVTAGCAATFASPDLEPFVDPLPIAPTVAAGGTVVMAPGRHRFHSALPLADTWGYGGAPYGGPLYEAHAGEPVEVTFVNNLGRHPLAAHLDLTIEGTHSGDADHPRAAVHLHGGITPPDSDGHPMDTFLPGQRRSYRWLNRQEATSLWFHDHAMGITRLSVHAGLFAVYQVRDEFDTGTPSNPIGLPAGEFEIPLVLQDRAFDDDGSVRFRAFRFVPEGSWEGGMIGDTIAVNGAVWPYLEVAPSVYRFRVLNGSNLTTFNLQFARRDGSGAVTPSPFPMWVIGNDQGMLDAPVPADRIKVSPAERVDILVDFSGLGPGETVEFVNDYPQPAQAAMFGTPVIGKVMQFRGAGTAGPIRTVPERLRGGAGRAGAIPSIDSMRATAVPLIRNVTISQAFADRNPPAFMTIDNLRFDDPAEHARQGTVEQWNLINTTFDDHPIHLHLARMRVIGRVTYSSIWYQLLNPAPGHLGEVWRPDADAFATGAEQPPADYETGWKDTIAAPGNTITRILVQWPTIGELGFDPDAEFPGTHGPLRGYVFHCHILDHEDNEMMRPIRTTK